MSISEKTLYIEYITNKKSLEQIATEYHKTVEEVYALIRFYGFMRLKIKKYGRVK